MNVETPTATAPRTNGRPKQPALFLHIRNTFGRLTTMPKRQLLLTTGSVLAGLWVASGVFRHLTAPRPVAAPAVQLAAATRDVERGTVFAPADLHLVPWPYATVPDGAFQDIGAILGRAARTHIPAESPVLESSLMPARTGAPLAASLPKGYRAIGVTVDSQDGMQRWLTPGDHVDVVATMHEGPYAALASSRILLQDSEVLALPDADQNATQHQAAGRGGVTVTLGVLPADAERLALAMHTGTLQLLLRHPTDAQALATSGVTSDTLLPEGAADDSSSAHPTYRSVELIAGRERTLQRFDASSGLAALPSPPPHANEAEALDVSEPPTTFGEPK